MAIRNLVGAVVLCALAGILVRLWPANALELAASWLPAGSTGTASAAPHRAAPPPAAAPTPQNALHVLFVGNSHTFYNDMPKMIAQLAAAAKLERPLDFAMQAPGGETLAGHLAGTAVRQRLSQRRWDFVVLQEQQQRPTFSFNPRQMEAEFYAPARTLDVLIRAAGARTVLYMTAARREGDPSNLPGDSYENMQERTREGYASLAGQIGATLAPVGVAWRAVRREHPDLQLWIADGSHPALPGSYLAACVLYSVLYGRPALDNPYTAGLPAADASALQRAADAARTL